MKTIITAAIIAISATAAHADKASDFAECMVSRIAAKNGNTVEQVRLIYPSTVHRAETNLIRMAHAYLDLNEYSRQGIQLEMRSRMPQSVHCRHILDN